MAMQIGLTAYTGALAALHALTLRAIPEAYMDEPFHMRQTQEYCAGNWDVWDEKITTFPGLYLIGAAAAAALRALGVAPAAACSLRALRAVNLLPALLTPLLAAALIRRHNPKTPLRDVHANAALVALMPTHFFYHALYYTDTWATCSVLALLLLAPRPALPAADSGDGDASEQPTRSGSAWQQRVASAAQQLAFAATCALAIALRQTNAVWVAFAVASTALRGRFLLGGLSKHPANVATAVRELCADAGALLRTLAAQGAPAVGLLFGFGAFVVHNRGVVVGDRSNHQPALHLAQLSYLTVVAAAPHVLWRAAWPPCLAPAARDAWRATRRTAPLALLAALALALLAAATTRSHPFLLADNRHVTFYLWRYLLGRHRLVPYVLAPAVAVLGALVYPPVWRAHGALIALGLLACCALVIVPSPLIEPRYYTLPALLLWLHAPPLTGPREWLAPLAAFALVNVGMLGVFLFRPYTWVDGSTAHFMW